MEQSEVTQSLEEQTSDTWRYVEYIESMKQQCLFNIEIKRKACAFQSILASRAPVSHEKVYKVTFKEKLLLCKIYENTLKCFFLICKSRENCFSTRLIICFASPFPREGKSHWEWYHPTWSRDMPTAARLLVVGSVGSDGEMLTDLVRHTFLVLPFSYIRRGKE